MRMPSICLILILVMVMPPCISGGQSTFSLKKTEQYLKEAFKDIGQAENDSARLALSLGFQKQLRVALSNSGSSDYPWDSLKFIAKTESPDGSFRLYNWNVPLLGGGNRYFCLIQFKGSMKKIPVVGLTDFSGSVAEPGQFSGDSLHWYGALYYKVIPFEQQDKTKAYILLGWAGISKDISGKIIEVMALGGNGTPAFGSPVFPGYLDGKLLRVVFRYASSAGMNLRYQLQILPGKPKWNAKKKEYTNSTGSQWMIVFDHLVPMDPQLAGQYQFYVPASETAEGFVYENFRWKYIGEFDARNP